jgi:MerR family transcriptional regulator, light-induced transcriptional regulator
MSSNDNNRLTIGEVARATGLGEATLRAWERRYAFPEPVREPRGHRRYPLEEVERIMRVVAQRDQGIALPLAIERVRAAPPATPSLYARLRERRPELAPIKVSKRQLTPLAHAIEEESAARAERAMLIGGFQRERFYRCSERRWRELARGAELAFVFADFPRTRSPRGAPAEISLDLSHPVVREWALICEAPEHSACLVAWEPPGREAERDADRSFELLLTVEPGAVREAAEAAVELAAAAAPELAGRARERLEQLGPPRPESQLRLSSAITARLLAGLREAEAR